MNFPSQMLAIYKRVASKAGWNSRILSEPTGSSTSNVDMDQVSRPKLDSQLKRASQALSFSRDVFLPTTATMLRNLHYLTSEKSEWTW